MSTSVDVAADTEAEATGDLELPGIGLRPFLAGFLVIGLVASSFFLTGRSPGAEAYVMGLYAQGPQALANAVDPDLLAHFGLTPETAAPQFSADPTAEVIGVEELLIEGVPVTRVDVSDNQQWCVRPDRVLLPGCIFGRVDVQVSPDFPTEVVLDPNPISSILATGNASPQSIFLLEALDQPDVELNGFPALSGATGAWSLEAVEQLVDRAAVPPTDQFVVGGSNGVVFVLTGTLDVQPAVDEGDVAEYLFQQASFDIVFENQTIPVSLSPVTWLG